MASILRKVGQAASRKWPFPVRVTTKTGARLYVDLRFSVGRSIYARGEFDPPLLKAILGALTPESVFLDVGANIGFYAVEAARVVTQGAIHAFEMEARSARCLEKSVRAFDLDRVKVHNTAVSDRTGVTYFQADRDEPGHSHLDPAAARGRPVPTVSIDDWAASHAISRVDIIKIDVEGAEVMVLEGARETLRRFRPMVLVEAAPASYARFGHTPADAVALLEGLGYTVEPLDGAWTATFVAR